MIALQKCQPDSCQGVRGDGWMVRCGGIEPKRKRKIERTHGHRQ